MEEPDALAAARRLLDDVATGRPVAHWLAPEARFRSDRDGTCDAAALERLLAARRAEASEFVVGDAMMRRNVVFVGVEWRRDGSTEASGTWVLSFDRHGRVASWSEMRA